MTCRLAWTFHTLRLKTELYYLIGPEHYISKVWRHWLRGSTKYSVPRTMSYPIRFQNATRRSLYARDTWIVTRRIYEIRLRTFWPHDCRDCINELAAVSQDRHTIDNESNAAVWLVFFQSTAILLINLITLYRLLPCSESTILILSFFIM